MYRVLIFSALVAVTLGGKSPHYDKVLEMEKSIPPGARYSTDIFEDAKLDAIGLLEKYGYPAERHSVVTSDGYILEMQRVPYGKGLDPNVVRTPVMIMHGLLSSSADFLVLGTGRALVYILADAGYDVWLGNARGNYYSRRHQTLDPDGGVEFWQFSWDQIGNFDLPAMIDHVLATTGHKKMHYVGHSQGGTSFLVMASLRPEYNDKILSFQGLAPASFFNHHENRFTRTLAPFSKLIEVTAHFWGMGELLGNRAPISWLAANFCADNSTYQELCISLAINGERVEYYNTTLLPLFLGHAPGGAALRQLRHYGQSISTKTFRRFDYGSSIANLIYYGRSTPPDYDLSQISAPTYLYYAMKDTLVNYQDLYHLAHSVGNLRGVYRALRTTFGHIDYMWGDDAKEQVYDSLLVTLKLAESLN